MKSHYDMFSLTSLKSGKSVNGTGSSVNSLWDRLIRREHSFKPRRYQQQCRRNVLLCCQKRQQCRTNFALKFVFSTKSNVASTMLLRHCCWCGSGTGFKHINRIDCCKGLAVVVRISLFTNKTLILCQVDNAVNFCYHSGFSKVLKTAFCIRNMFVNIYWY